jgi:hypothetical protein
MLQQFLFVFCCCNLRDVLRDRHGMDSVSAAPEAIFARGNVGNGRWCRFHRFFSHAGWDIDSLSMHLETISIHLSGL